MTETAPESPLEQALSDHMLKIRKKILSRAQQIASDTKDELSVTHLAAAIGEYAPGMQLVASGDGATRKWFIDYVPPVAFLSAVLAVAFAALGLWAIIGQPDVKTGLGGQGFLDIAKIFAGAIVGSATAVVASGGRGARG